MDPLSALLLYGAPLAVILLVYAVRRRRFRSRDAAAYAAALADGRHQPDSIHPQVDPSRCLGSGGCVRACPEGALGIVDGRAVLVHGDRCIGHGACERACPTEAIRLVFGRERRGVEIPAVSPRFESSVRGIYIAGELGGMGLIRKAAEQGRQALETIARTVERGRSDYDVAIVGAGPAGLAAGLAAIEHRLRYVLIEQEAALGGSVYHYPRHKVTVTEPIRLPLVGRLAVESGVSKEGLLAAWAEVVGRSGLAIRFGERLEGVARDGEHFVVHTSAGSHRAARVLLAIGRRGSVRRLGVPGEDSGKVVYRLVDAEQYDGRRVLVVGGGDSAAEAAAALAERGGVTVTLAHRSAVLERLRAASRSRLAAAVRSGRLQVMLQAQVVRIGAREVELRQQERTVTLPNDAVIACLGGELPTALLRGIGIRFASGDDAA